MHRLALNYELKLGRRTSLDDIMLKYVSEAEELPFKLARKKGVYVSSRNPRK